VTSAVSGPALRAGWDATCDRALALLDAACATTPGHLLTFLKQQRSSVRSIKADVDGRRRIPSPTLGIGILRDIPPQLDQPQYVEMMDALQAVRDLWNAQLGAAGWDWSKGYPPDWPSSFRDRLRAGLVYRKK
jgi:hypothetical protein